MKSLDTLIEDIYSVFQKDSAPSDEAIFAFGQRLARTLSERLSRRRERGGLRMSSIGTPCERKLWYSVNRPDAAKDFSGPTRIKFLFGDLIEELILFLAEVSGHDVKHRQREVTVEGVPGHIDGIIDGVVVDSKSASSYSYRKFKSGLKREEDSFGYLTQLGLYGHAAEQDGLVDGGNKKAFLVVDKQHGDLTLDIHEPDGRDYPAEVSRKKEIVDRPEPPPRPYSDEPDGQSGNRKLGLVCQYCDYKKECWPRVRGFAYSGAPKYLTVVKREPDVPEFKV